MSNELLNQLEEKINTAIETIELSRMEIGELKEQNEELAVQQVEWEERLTVLIEKFEQLESSDGSITASEENETEEDSNNSDNEAEQNESEGSTFGTESSNYTETSDNTDHYA